MRIRIKGNVRVYDDTDETSPLIALDDRLSEILVDGHLEQSSGRAVIAQGGSFTIPLGSVASPRGLMVRVYGTSGVNLAINSQAVRQIRAPTTAAGPTTTTPVGLYVETCDNVTTAVLSHPGSAGAANIEVIWVIFGDPAA